MVLGEASTTCCAVQRAEGASVDPQIPRPGLSALTTRRTARPGQHYRVTAAWRTASPLHSPGRLKILSPPAKWRPFAWAANPSLPWDDPRPIAPRQPVRRPHRRSDRPGNRREFGGGTAKKSTATSAWAWFRRKVFHV